MLKFIDNQVYYIGKIFANLYSFKAYLNKRKGLVQTNRF